LQYPNPQNATRNNFLPEIARVSLHPAKKAASVLIFSYSRLMPIISPSLSPETTSTSLPLDVVFVAIGHLPLSKIAADCGAAIDAHGYVKINRNSETNVPGFYAAGDVTDTRFKQAIVGVGEAVEAVYSAYLYLGGGKK